MDDCVAVVDGMLLLEDDPEGAIVPWLSACGGSAVLGVADDMKGVAWAPARLAGLMTLGVAPAADAAAASCHLVWGLLLVHSRLRRTWLHFSGDASDALRISQDCRAPSSSMLI